MYGLNWWIRRFFIVVGEGKRKNMSVSSLAMLLITQHTHETAIQTEKI